MSRSLAFLLVLAVLSLPPAGTVAAGQEDAYPWRIEELAPGVYSALQPADTRFDDSNSVIVVGPHEVLLVDAQADAAGVRSLQERIAGLTDLPVRTLVNTHWHSDHTMGNALHRERYGPELRILGHATLIEDVPDRAAAMIDEQREYFEAELEPARRRLEEGVDREGRVMNRETRDAAAAQIAAAERWLEANRDARFESPDVVIGSALASSRLGRTVQLIHAPGHTRGDLVVWLPGEKLLIAGDIVDAMPFAGHGAPAQWGRTLRSLLELDFEVVVPGHGPLYRGRERVETLAAYFEDLAAQAADAVASGLTLEATLEAVDLEPWRERLAEDEEARVFFDQVRAEAVRAAWEEAGGVDPGV